MIRLLRAEFGRIRSRRMTWGVVAAALAIVGLLAFGVYSSGRPPSADELQQSQAAYQQASAEWKTNGRDMVAQCKADEANERKTNPEADYGCEAMREPRLEDFARPPMRLGPTLTGARLPVGFLAGFLSFLFGTSLVAAEFSTGAIGNWLTFVPRRFQVYVAKVGAVGLTATVGAALLTALTAGLLWAAVAVNGGATTLEGTGGLGTGALRIVALAAGAAVAGAGCGFLFRHTAAVLGTLIGYLVVVEMIGQGVFEWLRPYLLTNAVSAWLAGGWRYFTNECVTDPTGGYSCQSKEHLISLAWGATELAVAVLLAVVLGAVAFRRRDVT